MYKIEYLEIAKQDIDNIIHYISYNLNNRKAASELIYNFSKEINRITIFPYGNSEYNPIKKLKNTYRKTKIKNYLIFYTINEKEKTIIITRIIYYNRNLDKILT